MWDGSLENSPSDFIYKIEWLWVEFEQVLQGYLIDQKIEATWVVNKHNMNGGVN